jgi:hypothetical protein
MKRRNNKTYLSYNDDSKKKFLMSTIIAVTVIVRVENDDMTYDTHYHISVIFHIWDDLNKKWIILITTYIKNIYNAMRTQ